MKLKNVLALICAMTMLACSIVFTTSIMTGAVRQMLLLLKISFMLLILSTSAMNFVQNMVFCVEGYRFDDGVCDI